MFGIRINAGKCRLLSITFNDFTCTGCPFCCSFSVFLLLILPRMLTTGRLHILKSQKSRRWIVDWNSSTWMKQSSLVPARTCPRAFPTLMITVSTCSFHRSTPAISPQFWAIFGLVRLVALNSWVPEWSQSVITEWSQSFYSFIESLSKVLELKRSVLPVPFSRFSSGLVFFCHGLGFFFSSSYGLP